jgi:biopolymer transport protein ExbD
MAKARAGHAHRRWRISSKKAHVDVVRNDINVTPLVDVMLVLLIIFMLMTMLMGRGQDVKIPRARNISTQPDMLQPIVTIDEKGVMFVEKRKVGEIKTNDAAADKKHLEEMGELVKAVWTKKPRGNMKIYVKAHQDIPYSTVYPVLEYLNRNLNLEAIDLAVAESSRE